MSVYSSIDIGTNTIRLLIAEKLPRCGIKAVYQESKIARLGEGFLPSKILKPKAIERALNILKDYKEITYKYNSRKTFVAATSAVREAKNKEEFLTATTKIGFKINIINEIQEAKLTHLGIVHFIKSFIKDKIWMAFDLGGGSTEFMFSKEDKLLGAFSIPMGVVKLLERFVKHDPPLVAELENLGLLFIGELKEKIGNINPDLIVANAGTVTSLAAIDMHLEKYSYKRTEGYKLYKEKVDKILSEMLKMNSNERLKTYPTLENGREDVIVVGAYLVKRILEFFSKDHLLVTNGSLREGLIIKELCYGE